MNSSVLVAPKSFISKHFNVQPVAGRIGAEIVGLDLSSPLGDEVISDIRKALVGSASICVGLGKLEGQLLPSKTYGMSPVRSSQHSQTW